MCPRNSVVCAMFAWHLVDWVYNEYPALASGHASKTSFQQFVKSQCPSMDYMQDVANGTKHRAITKYVPIVKKAVLHHGAFSNAFSKGFDVSCLKLTLDGGKVVYFDEEVTKAREFWKNYFASTLGVFV